MVNQRDDAALLHKLRKEIFVTGYRGGMAHLASCFSALETIYALYLKDVLRYDPQNPEWADRDRFILSKGHAGLALYGVMMEAGLIAEEEYHSYLQPDCHIGGEPCMRDSKWVEATTGSLGHGLSMGVGIAMALKMNGNAAKVYVMLGDGECQEGTVWEAAMSAAAFKLDNLVVILDCNRIQKMDYVSVAMGEEHWHDRWSAFGFTVDDVDGHNVDAIAQILKKDNVLEKPRLVIAHTVKGKGISVMENNPNWHFKLPGRKELKVFKEELGVMDWELE